MYVSLWCLSSIFLMVILYHWYIMLNLFVRSAKRVQFSAIWMSLLCRASVYQRIGMGKMAEREGEKWGYTRWAPPTPSHSLCLNRWPQYLTPHMMALMCHYPVHPILSSFCVVSHLCSLLVCVSVVCLFYFLIGELAPLLSVLGTKCISATNPRRAESPDLDPVAMHYLVLFLISFCSVSASSQLVKPS